MLPSRSIPKEIRMSSHRVRTAALLLPGLLVFALVAGSAAAAPPATGSSAVRDSAKTR